MPAPHRGVLRNQQSLWTFTVMCSRAGMRQRQKRWLQFRLQPHPWPLAVGELNARLL
jgi:hypothetical protein